MTALLFTLGVFTFILVLARLKVPLALAILAGGAAMGLLFGIRGELGGVLLTGAVQPQTIGLAIVTVLLLTVSGAMQAGGQMQRIVSAAKAIFRRPTLTMAALPALIGMLPMPGGALFSAPMVASAAGDEKISGGKLSAVNYWFRHIWEHWFPLYPGVITALALTKLDVGAFILTQFPLSLCMITGGLLILRRIPTNLQTTAPPPRGTYRKLLGGTSSIWMILLIWAAGRGALYLVPTDRLFGQLAGEIEKYLPLVIGLVASWAWTIHLNRLSARQVGRIVAAWRIWSIVLLVISVMIFQHMLSAVDAPARIGEGLTKAHVPFVLVMAALPFIAGMVTGLAVGFVGTSFPIVLALVPPDESIRPYVVLAYAFGHLGQMCSPLHLCHVVSNRFFKTGYGPVYRELLPAAAVAGTLSVAYFLLLKLLL